MLREKWREQLPQGSAGDIASRFLEQLSDDDLAQLGFEALIGRAQWAQAQIADGQKVECLNPEVERDGWGCPHSLLALCLPDQPFLIDTLRLETRRHGRAIHLTQNLVLSPQDPLNPHSKPLAIVLIEFDRLSDKTAVRTFISAIRQVLKVLGAAVEDYESMRTAALAFGDSLAGQEGEFFKWLAQDHFTFLGYCNSEGAHQGIVRIQPNLIEMPQAELAQICFEKAAQRSPIHRNAYMDRIVFSSGGVEHQFLGLYTARVYQQLATDIPCIRDKISAVLAGSGFTPGGHNYKQLLQILQVFPRDELLQIEESELSLQALAVVRLQERQRSLLTLRLDRLGQFATVLLYVPRERYDTELRVKIQAMLHRKLQAEDIEFNTTFSESVHTRVQFIIRLGKHPVQVTQETLQASAFDLMVSWEEGLAQKLIDSLGAREGGQWAKRFIPQIPAGFREEVDLDRALIDLRHLDELNEDNPLAVSLFQDLAQQTLHLKLYHLGRAIPLSEALPMMEHLGVRVIEDQTYAARDKSWFIHDFRLELPFEHAPLSDWRDMWQQAFLAVWHGQTESDAFNGLVIHGGIPWRDIALLRSLASYIKQIGFELSQPWIAGTLVGHPELSRELVQLFYARHEPGRSATLQTRVLARLDSMIDEVAGLNEDRLFRRYREVIMASDRVNFFQRHGPRAVVSLAFKFAPGRITDIPKPVPLHEIFVYSARVEGVHLRLGNVSRGGLRWSDRLEDYRTEVLGLVKAQQVKNSVIVPEGAKGGFVAKALPLDPDARQAEGVAAYQEFIRGMLSLTDNLKDQTIIPPPDLIRHDTDDPYLVVAADKGTATFSDLANQIAVEADFWMDDAFASGGSAGYDHKQMGITARGAWVSVIHHFRELGKDPSKDAFSMVGIGDMSGDVFGNGLLLSDQALLIGAFNHRHIFVDPTPDPARSFAERKRLFKLPRSSWSDYDREMLSTGGAVFERSAKSVELSVEAAQVLGVAPGARTPNQLIRELLMAEVDLLFNGGIGTYIKSERESHVQVGDKANDAIRIDASEVRAAVIGEGGNLGVTQLGRVEMSANGVLVNTDFIDNSAGVDCSDHEVNLKILLSQPELAGELTRKQRDRLLSSLTDQVASLVLANNDRQAGALAMASFEAQRSAMEAGRLIHWLTAQGELNPQLECIRTDSQPLTRPELAVLMATEKNRLKRALVGLDQSPAMAMLAQDAFPPEVRETYADEIKRHRLAPQLVATQMANAMVHFLGVTIPYRLEQLSGASPITIAKAFQVVRVIFKLDQKWDEIETLPSAVTLETRRVLLARLSAMARRTTRWMLRRHGEHIDVDDLIKTYQTGVDELIEAIPAVLRGAPEQHFCAFRDQWTEQGVSPALASFLAATPSLAAAPAVIEAARETQTETRWAADAFMVLGESLGLQSFAHAVNALSVSNAWEARARDGLRDDIDRAYLRLINAIAQFEGDAVDQRIKVWMSKQPEAIKQWNEILMAAVEGDSQSYPLMAVAGRSLAQLAMTANNT